MPRIFEYVNLRSEASSADDPSIAPRSAEGPDASLVRPDRPRHRATYWVAAVIACLALLFGLLLLWRFPPFLDEAIYSGWTARIAADPSERFVPLANGKEPLFEWLAATMTTLGISAFTAGRLVSVVTSFGTIALVAALGGIVSGRRVALTSGLLCAICPFLVVYGVLGLYETLATFLVTATLLLQILLARTLRLDVALVLGASLGLGLLTKQSALLAFVLWPMSLVLVDWSRPALAARLTRLAGLALLSAAVAYAIASILRLSEFYDDLGRLRKELYPVHSVSDALSTPGAWLEQNWPAYRDVMETYVTPAVILAAAIGVGLGLRRKAPLTSVLIAWTVTPLVTAALLADAPYPRYVHVTGPPLLVLAAMGCVWTADALASSLRASRRPGLAPFALPLVVGLVVLHPLLFDVRLAVNPTSVTFPGLDEEQFVTGWPAGTGLKEVKRELEARAARSGAVVVLLGPQAPGWLSYTMRNDSRFRLVPSDSDEPSALFALENGAPLPPRTDSLAWSPIRHVERPRNGVPLVLYESGIQYGGRFVASPEELRRLIVPDARFDEYVAERPAVKAWLESWYAANG
jgi:4-amino-4-deoxy-L-arabinose transferase-like glycosyltransferase